MTEWDVELLSTTLLWDVELVAGDREGEAAIGAVASVSATGEAHITYPVEFETDREGAASITALASVSGVGAKGASGLAAILATAACDAGGTMGASGVASVGAVASVEAAGIAALVAAREVRMLDGAGSVTVWR